MNEGKSNSNYAINPTPELYLRSNRAILPARVIAALGVFGMNRIFELLAARGWRVLVQEGSVLRLPMDIELRYAKLPNDVREFLWKIESCTSPEEESWLLGAPDYNSASGSGCSWDGIEKIALEDCESPGERAELVRFWDNHFPIAISVRSDYAYLAVCLAPEAFGCVVHGYAPEWENPKLLALSFSGFLEAFECALSEPDPPYPFSVFV